MLGIFLSVPLLIVGRYQCETCSLVNISQSQLFEIDSKVLVLFLNVFNQIINIKKGRELQKYLKKLKY